NIANQPFTTENASQCRQECTKNDTCQYFTFVDENAGIEVHRYMLKNDIFMLGQMKAEISFFNQHHSDNYYHIICDIYLTETNKNWTEAQEYCTKHYTNLAIIRTEEDWKAIQTSLGNFSGDVWIGLHRSGPTEKWKWSDGEDFMFFNWEKGFGVHTEGHNCVFSLSSHWQPVACTAERQYMCQRGKD
uniref:C-type lectin domain-containing protein n=1 Tax=Salmo trutta TaxID=8032 RepID=A0A673Z2D8_SALTR